MGKIAIITDSVADHPQELAQQYHTHITPASTFPLEGKMYRQTNNHSSQWLSPWIFLISISLLNL